MVILFSYVNPLLLLFSTAFVVIHGFRRNPVDEETTLVGYRLEEDSNFHAKRNTDKNLMWIGPRLGRRKRSEEENMPNVALPEKNGGTVVEFLQDSPWAFVALKGGKRRTVNFIPRLGRDSEEEFDSSMDSSSYAKSSSRSGNQLETFGGSNNFTPRLGRSPADADLVFPDDRHPEQGFPFESCARQRHLVSKIIKFIGISPSLQKSAAVFRENPSAGKFYFLRRSYHHFHLEHFCMRRESEMTAEISGTGGGDERKVDHRKNKRGKSIKNSKKWRNSGQRNQKRIDSRRRKRKRGVMETVQAKESEKLKKTEKRNAIEE